MSEDSIFGEADAVQLPLHAWILLYVPFKHRDEWLDWDDVEQPVR